MSLRAAVVLVSGVPELVHTIGNTEVVSANVSENEKK